MEKLTISAMFNSKLFVYQRVYSQSMETRRHLLGVAASTNISGTWENVNQMEIRKKQTIIMDDLIISPYKPIYYHLHMCVYTHINICICVYRYRYIELYRYAANNTLTNPSEFIPPLSAVKKIGSTLEEVIVIRHWMMTPGSLPMTSETFIVYIMSA